ncbi:Uncharacterised protein [Mycobacteroides abscessus subsp. abscessus]|nr:Uncharacterised protein [Mycobacteroides abscessus subsp. abscessus]
MLVAFSRNPPVVNGFELHRGGDGLLVQRDQVRMLDLPPAGHLLDDKFGVHRDAHLGGSQACRLGQSRYQAPVLGDIVGRMSDGVASLPQHRLVIGRKHHRAISGQTWVTA